MHDYTVPEVVDDGNDEEEGCEAGGSDGPSDPIVLIGKILFYNNFTIREIFEHLIDIFKMCQVVMAPLIPLFWRGNVLFFN